MTLTMQDPLLGDVIRDRNSELNVSSYLGLEETQHHILLWLEKFHFDAKKIDVMSRILFPASFMLFTGSYWVYYTKIYT